MKVAVVGATGLVGTKMLQVLAERKFPVTELIPVASERSVGKEILFKGKSYKIVSMDDANGRRVRYLLKNELLGAVNRFTWDGCDDRSKILPSGIYIVLTQVFDLKGNVKKYRNCIVLNSFPP